ncbi:MAG: DUF4231 domain-containing protein [Acidimicrobiales bacterium]
MAADGYREWMREDFDQMIALVEVTDVQRRFLRSRWLDQVLWAEGKAPRMQRWHHSLRVAAVMGGVLVPALVSLDVGGTAARASRWVAFGLGVLVAIAVSLEASFRFGEQWRHYRRTAELLKIEGWQFFQSAGPYAGQAPAASFPTFAARTESILQRDLDSFISVIAADRPDDAGAGVPDPPAPWAAGGMSRLKPGPPEA